MGTNLTFATGRFPQAVRFVLVNNRVARADQHCTLCGGLVEKGYVRDSRTRLIYCDMQCFAGVMTIKSKPAVITTSGVLGPPAFAEFPQTDSTFPARRR